MATATRRRKLHFAEAKRAIHIDYEGNTDKPPTLLGWRIDGRNHSAIVEPAFATCVGRWGAKGTHLADHATLVRELIGQAQEEDRVIVSWSEHDLRHMQQVVGDDQAGALIAHFRNALKTVKPWFRNNYGKRESAATLGFFMDLIDFRVPQRFGIGLVGDALRLVRDQLQEGRSYVQLTPAARRAWVRVVKHNRYDLEGMEAVLLKVLGDTDGAGSSGEVAGR